VRAGVIARILAEGVPHSEPSWSSPRDPIYKILKPAEKVRIRELGCLDASQAIVLEDTIAGAKKLFEEKTLPIVLQRVQGGTQKPGPSCRGYSFAKGSRWNSKTWTKLQRLSCQHNVSDSAK